LSYGFLGRILCLALGTCNDFKVKEYIYISSELADNFEAKDEGEKGLAYFAFGASCLSFLG
jgi:hypothetical protein